MTAYNVYQPVYASVEGVPHLVDLRTVARVKVATAKAALAAAKKAGFSAPIVAPDGDVTSPANKETRK